MRKRVILVSLDALAGSELEIVRRLPGFGRMVRQGAFCNRERSVYPSLTFPCHATIATGCLPAQHGIVHNYLLEPQTETDNWNFYAKNLNRRALWDYAEECGAQVLSMSWPVSAGAKIRWSMPEMTPAKPKIWKEEIFAEQMRIFRTYGNGDFAQEVLEDNPGLVRHWFVGEQPQLDDAMLTAFGKELRRRDFDLALLHVYGMDDAKHRYGSASAEAHQYLLRYDRFVQELLAFSDASRARGEDIAVLITGDHSQKDIHSYLFGNELLAAAGYSAWEGRRLKRWDAYFHGGDGMAYLYIYDLHNRAILLPKLKALFEENPAIKRVMEKPEFALLGCGQQADLVLEAEDGYDLESMRATVPIDKNGIGKAVDCKAAHGYLPECEGYYTMFLAYGPTVRQTEIEKMCIADIAPTVCAWMGWPTDPMDGQVVPQIFGPVQGRPIKERTGP